MNWPPGTRADSACTDCRDDPLAMSGKMSHDAERAAYLLSVPRVRGGSLASANLRASRDACSVIPHSFSRIMPSWATLAIKVPSWANINPWPSPRPFWADGEACR